MKQRLVAHPKYGVMLEKEHEFYFKKNKRTERSKVNKKEQPQE